MLTTPIAQLQSDFKGKVVSPNDAEYDKLRTVFYGGVDRKPAVIILAANSDDVQKAVKLAVSTGSELAVRSGGHSIAGYSVTQGGIVLDLRTMKAHEINTTDQTMWVEPGMTAIEVSKAADEHGLAVGFGDTGSVGVGGITLGGGIGFLVRKMGMAIDNLLEADIVTADGQLLHVSATEHPDLFWAIRGGGGNFGVVTRFKFQLHPLTQVVGGMLVLPAEPQVLVKFMDAALKAPDELSTIVNIMPAPPMPMIPTEHHGKLIMMAIMLYAGPEQQGQQVLAPFRSLTTPLGDTIHPMRYPEIFFPDDDSYHPTAVSKTMFMKHIDETNAALIIERLKTSDASMRVVQLRALGGAMARVPVEATAFAHRMSTIMTNVAAFYTSPEDKKVREAWVKEFADELNQGDNGAYIGFLGEDGQQRLNDAYPQATLQKLQEVKRQYDPNNLFKLNLNIQPA